MVEKALKMYSQLTLRMILLLTAGGTSLEAIQRNAPICRRSSRQKCIMLPLYVSTGTTNKRSLVRIHSQLSQSECRPGLEAEKSAQKIERGSGAEKIYLKF